MTAAPVRRALSPEINGNAADVSGRQMERSPSKALTDAYAQPSKIPKFYQAGTSTGSLQRQASRGIQCCLSQLKLDLRCKPAYACMMHFPQHLCHHNCYIAISLCTVWQVRKHARMTCSVVLHAIKTAPFG